MSRFAQPLIDHATAALWLRLGLGSVFVIGGWFKLSSLLHPAFHDALVAKYMSPAGYINAFFQDWMFGGPLGHVLSPWGFLTMLSTFELLAGLALLVGFLVRPLALIFGLLLWSFVAALPVTVTPGATVTETTYLSPALLVQIRDVGLSGMMFALFVLGPGRLGVDGWLFGRERPDVDWDALGLLLRLSLGVPLVVGGVFAGLDHIKSWDIWAPLLVVVGAALIAGVRTRAAAVAAAMGMLWFAALSIRPEASLVVNLNGFKRELALLAAGLVVAACGGGVRFTLIDIYRRVAGALAAARDRHLPGRMADAD